MKYGVFEFEVDRSVEVAEISWIVWREDEAPITNPLELIDKTVTVKWPGSGGSSNSKTKSKSYRAKVVAVGDDKVRLCEKRNKHIKGQSVETDTELGRGMRKTKRRSRDSSPDLSDQSDSDSDVPMPLQPPPKKTKKVTVTDCNKVASQLRRQMSKIGTVISDSSDNETALDLDQVRQLEKKNRELQSLLESERREKDALKNTLLLLQDKIPLFVQTFTKFEERFATSAKNISPSVQQQPDHNHHMQEEACDLEKDSDCMVELSPKVRLSKKSLVACNHRDFAKLTNDLLVALFGREDLHKFSLTGAPNSQGGKKAALDKDKVDALVLYVQKKFPQSQTSTIRAVITNKLSNEVKMKRRRDNEAAKKDS
ncbi:uncharacterized protein LOC121420224 [Lytechinus variegatus]|uniref:uncharacterized protein LOC121420224 n=1 Tax=Lytechinus variegatus TaxID=7654 RepID=UPI001BB18285|nr:uncharacterized protein LOC121420224 [Lytechinus variegatus]